MRTVWQKSALSARKHFGTQSFELFRSALVVVVTRLPLLLALQPAAHAQNSTNDAATLELEEVTVTGSRRQTKSPTDLAAPVDVVGVNQLSSQGPTNLSELLRTAVPSFNVSEQPISGTATSVRPANLRGLSPDHVLVLINGKRLHRSADIPTFGTALLIGSQGPDLASIPAIALKQVEVLRDGAAAQYGADAIAGVMNFILNDDPHKSLIDLKTGQYAKGDGTMYSLAGTFGLQLGDDGFIRFSGEYSDSDRTNRSRAANLDAIQALVDAGITEAARENVVWGSPEIKDNSKLFVNMAIDAGASAQLYGFGSYAERKTFGGFFYRSPNNRDGVFTSNGFRLVGDLTPNDANFCQGTVGGGGLVRADGSAADRAVIAAAAADPNCFTWANIFPGGYSPLFGSRLEDAAATIGLRGEMSGGMTWDVSAGFGQNELAFNISNDSAPSFGNDNAITSFPDLGSRKQQELVFNLDVAKGFDVGFHSPLNVAAGLQWHEEKWSVHVGQPESYVKGPLFEQGFASGTDGYFGYGPPSAGSFKRHNIAVYVDAEADVTHNLLLGAAVRYEDFSDLGSEVVGKLSGLLHITDSFGIRGTASTGFHAPTPAQQNIVYFVDEGDGAGNLTTSAIIPSSYSVAESFGARPAVPEISTNFSVGVVLDGPISATLDVYQIEIKDRISLSGTFTITDVQRQELADAGLVGAESFATVQFFTNDFKTRTKGVDLIVTVPFELWSGASSLSLAANWNETEVLKRTAITSDSQKFSLENGLPQTRASATFEHTADEWRGLIRTNYYGDSTSRLFGCCDLPSGSATTVDLEVGFNIVRSLEISVGGQNIFDARPTDVSNEGISGAVGTRYAPETPWGFNGTFWYARASYRFH